VRVTVTVTGANGSVYAASTDVAVKVRLGGISLSTMDLHLAPGQTAALTATLLPSGAEGTVQWTATDERIATVSSAGVVTAVGVGTTTVTATCGTFMAVCTVVVAVPVTGVQLTTATAVKASAIAADLTPSSAEDAFANAGGPAPTRAPAPRARGIPSDDTFPFRDSRPRRGSEARKARGIASKPSNCDRHAKFYLYRRGGA
jgi:predicted aspartyl protease